MFGTDFGSLLKRAKDQGKRFIVAENVEGKEFKIYFTEDNKRLPDFLTGIIVEVCKTISKASGGKYSPTSALDAVLTQVTATARIILEDYENESNGESGYNDLPKDNVRSIN